MKSALHASYSAIRRFLRNVVGLKFSRGYLVKLIARVSCALQDPYEQLMAALANEPALHVDETGHKDNGQRFWTWVFRAELYVLFKIEDTRSSQVLIDVLGDEFNGVLGCDFFSAYRKYMREFDVRVQFCLAHLIREIRYLCGLPEGPGPAYGHKLLEAIREMFALIARAQDKGLMYSGSYNSPSATVIFPRLKGVLARRWSRERPPRGHDQSAAIPKVDEELSDDRKDRAERGQGGSGPEDGA